MSYKKLALTFLACFTSGLLPAETKKPEIRSDIHKVLVKPNRFRLAALLTGIPELLYVAARAKLVDPLLYKKPTANQQLAREALSLYRSGDVSGEGFYHLFKKYNKMGLARMVSAISNGYHPMPGMQELVDELTAAGYTLRPASNIGSAFYLEMKRRNPDLFKNFSAGKTVQFVDEEGNIVKNLVKKPDPRFYQEYDQEYPTDNGVLFIDDSKKNCDAAKAHGWDTIHFKNAKQLRQELIEKGLLQA